jgi:general secretion pathway protein D
MKKSARWNVLFATTLTAVTAVTLVTLQISIPAQAQFDDFESDFEAAPPPPAPSPDQGGFDGEENFSSPSPSSSGKSSSSGKNDDGGVLTKERKEKLAKSGIEDITSSNFPETIESFDFPNADITDVVKAISELTGRNFIIDQGVRGKITIIAPTKITVAEAYKAFLSALAINGYAVVPSGGFYKIRSARNAQRDSIETYSGAYYPTSDQMITRIIHLKHISAENVNRDLRILTSKDGEMSVYNQTNSLIISDYGANIERVMKIIDQLDVPGFDDQLEVIPVKYAKAKDIAELIDKIVNKGQGNNNRSGGSFSAGVPRFNRGGNTGGGAQFMVIPDDRTNSLIVTGNKAGLVRIKKLLGQLDFRMRPEDSGGVFVYYVKNGDAEKIAQTLQGIAKEGAPKPSTGPSFPGAPPINPTTGAVTGPAEIFGGEVKISADKGTNSLVIVASKPDYDVVLSLLSKLDIARDQVAVETIFMEMSASDATNYEIGYFNYVDKSGAKVGFNTLNNIGDLLNPSSGRGTILGFGSGSIDIKPPGATTATTLPSLVGFINFLKTNANANILSSPHIMAQDNQEALLIVGDKVVTSQTQSTTTGGQTITTPTFEDATIEVKLKPFVSPSSETVRLEIDTKVTQLSNVLPPDAFKSSTQPLAKRQIKTNIVVPNGDTAVLGGLTKDNDIEEVTKVPLLGDIPILGWLFKSRRTQKVKSNLMVFLTPKIVRSADDSRRILSEKMDERLEYIKATGGRDAFGAKADKLQRRAKSDTPADLPATE